MNLVRISNSKFCSSLLGPDQPKKIPGILTKYDNVYKNCNNIMSLICVRQILISVSPLMLKSSCLRDIVFNAMHVRSTNKSTRCVGNVMFMNSYLFIYFFALFLLSILIVNIYIYISITNIERPMECAFLCHRTPTSIHQFLS